MPGSFSERAHVELLRVHNEPQSTLLHNFGEFQLMIINMFSTISAAWNHHREDAHLEQHQKGPHSRVSDYDIRFEGEATESLWINHRMHNTGKV